MTQRGGQPVGAAASGSAFRELGTSLAQEFLDDLEQEHRREMDVLYEEQLTLRRELERVVPMMKNEIAPRERLLHQMFDTLRDAYEKSTTELHNQMQNHLQAMRQANSQGDGHRRQLLNPMEEMDKELDRIGQLLQRPLVAPNVQGWAPPTKSPPRSPSRLGCPIAGTLGTARLGGGASPSVPGRELPRSPGSASETAGGGGGTHLAGGGGSSFGGGGAGMLV